MTRLEDVLIDEIRADREGLAAAVSEAQVWRPYRVKFKLVDGCNAKCVMCNHWRRTERTQNLLSPERLLELAGELHAAGTRWVTWTGGEPTLRRDLPQVIARLSELGIGSTILTNGIVMNEAYVEKLLAARVARMDISLESADPEVHDRMVGVRGAWHKTVSNALMLATRSAWVPDLSLQAVLTSINIGPGLLGLPALANEMGAGSIYLERLYFSHLADLDQARLVPPREMAETFRNQYLPEIRKRADRLGVKICCASADGTGPMIEGSGMGRTGRYYRYPDRLCYLPFFSVTIDHQGNVVVCSSYRTGAGIIGNILNGTFQDALRSQAGVAFRSQLRLAQVEGCGDCSMGAATNEMIQRLVCDAAPPARCCAAAGPIVRSAR